MQDTFVLLKVTMYHFDQPLELLRNKMSWADRGIIENFVGYADFLFKEYGDKVSIVKVYSIVVTKFAVSAPNAFLKEFFVYKNDALPQVKLWTTINEPNYYCITFAMLPIPGYYTPDIADEYKCIHHTVLAHAYVYRLYESKYRKTQQGKWSPRV